MNYEKIRNYNQFLLAMAGTAMLLFIVIGGIFIVYEEIIPSFQDDYNIGILSTEETNQLNKDSLRKQIISFNEMNTIDSTQQLYLIPVSQADLLEYERSNNLLGLVNIYDEREFRNTNGIHNNLVICDLINEESKIIFETRVSISNYFIHKLKGKKYLIIRASGTDTNKDKYLNYDDLQELYVYDIQLAKLSKIESKENFTTIKVYHPEKSNELIGKFGLDKDKNGEFNSGREPSIFYKIDVNKHKLINLIEDDQIERLQKQLEGAK